MPYTSPSAQSPASSKPTSPVTSRSSSYHEDLPRSPITARPQPPRSMSSASYLHRHRRSPSLSHASDVAPPTPTEAPASRDVVAVDKTPLDSLRQSPPPVNNLRIPTGAVISPPDSLENSDGDEPSRRERGRELEKNWNELQEAVWAIPQQREGSPEKHVALRLERPSEQTTQVTPPVALSAEARKISHSRSSTETKIMIKPPVYEESPIQTTDDSDEDDEGSFVKPSLVRKKSGELVKPALRPSSRRRYSSMPGTPTYSKSVHFNDNGNQTRHFLQVDKPIAVSAGTSPVETYDSETEFPFDEPRIELGIRINNFPGDTFERRAKPVRVERIALSSDKSMLVGTCAVQNLAFQKLVAARFTLDYWKTTSEVKAEFSNAPNTTSDGCDRFTFQIKLSDQANIMSKTMLLCVRYHVGGQEYWDNNDNTNYQIDFTKVEIKPAGKSSRSPQSHGLGQRPLNAIPRSRHSPPTSRHGAKHESIDDDFVTRFDTKSTYNFSSADTLLGESPTSIKLKPKSKRAPMFPSGPASPPANGLGSRYDFGSSLSAALSAAQDKPGRHGSPIQNAAKSQADHGYFGPVARTEPVKQDIKTERPDSLTTDRPAMGSDQYRDLVQKFCYFTSGSGKAAASPIGTSKNPASREDAVASPAIDGAADAESSSSSSDTSPSSSPQLDGANDRSSILTSFLARSGSPSRNSSSLSARSASPVSFGYPYHHASSRDGYLSDSSSRQAILG